MIYTRRFWRHASVLASRSFGQGVVVALGGEVFHAWNITDAKGVLFAGAGMAATSLAMSMGRATVAPHRNTPPDLVAINAAVDKQFADAYTEAIYGPGYSPRPSDDTKDMVSQSIEGWSPPVIADNGYTEGTL